MFQPLTKRQREILDYLAMFIPRHGYAPSLEEIGRRFDLSSLATVSKHLENLRAKGYIDRRYGHARAITIKSTGDICPMCCRPFKNNIESRSESA